MDNQFNENDAADFHNILEEENHGGDQMPPVQPCGACKGGKKGACPQNCPFRPFLPFDRWREIAPVSKYYGRQIMTEWVGRYGNDEDKRQVLENRIYEANVLKRDEFGGCAVILQQRHTTIQDQIMTTALQGRQIQQNLGVLGLILPILRDGITPAEINTLEQHIQQAHEGTSSILNFRTNCI